MITENFDSKQHFKIVKCEDVNDVAVVKLEPEHRLDLEHVDAPYKLVLNDEIDFLNLKHEDEEPKLEKFQFQSIHVPNIFNCLQCNFKATDQNELRTHQVVHTNTDNVCQNTLNRKLFTKFKNAAGIRNYECYHCEYKSLKKCNLTRHLFKHASGKKYKCAPSKSSHLLNHTDIQQYECAKCEYKTHRKWNLTNHLVIHSGIKKYKCHHCEYRSNRKDTLKFHLLKHLKYTGRNHQCDQCEFNSFRKGDFNRHLLKHVGIKKYQCDQCEFKSFRKSDLNRHLLKHTGVRKYPCEQCDYKAGRKEHLKSHLLKHVGIKKYQCDQCQFKSFRKSNLNRHLLKHTKVRKYQCE